MIKHPMNSDGFEASTYFLPTVYCSRKLSSPMAQQSFEHNQTDVTTLFIIDYIRKTAHFETSRTYRTCMILNTFSIFSTGSKIAINGHFAFWFTLPFLRVFKHQRVRRISAELSWIIRHRGIFNHQKSSLGSNNIAIYWSDVNGFVDYYRLNLAFAE